MQNSIKEVNGEGWQPDGLLVLRTLTMPKDCNPNGDFFGGWILCQMDIGGGLLAKEVAHSRVVTVTMDNKDVSNFMSNYSKEWRIAMKVIAPPAEREASGSPPEGGCDVRKAPLGLFTRH